MEFNFYLYRAFCIIITIKSSTAMSYMHSIKKSYGTEMPTAVKSQYQEVSPYRRDYDSSSFKSPSRHSAKIQQARQDITNLIGEMSAKKNGNDRAIERVKYTNQQALEYLNTGQSYSSFTPKRLFKSGDGRSTDYMGDYSPKPFMDDFQKQPSEFYLGQANDEGQVDLQSENIELRRALNEQIRINNELMHKIESLQRENESLRKSSRPTPPDSYFPRNQIPSSILSELEELKRQNNLLRKDTVTLLQKQRLY